MLYIAPQMQCTLDQLDATIDMGNKCSQWRSKQEYSAIALGGVANFNFLNIDMEIFGSRFANKLIEGGVRPPSFE